MKNLNFFDTGTSSAQFVAEMATVEDDVMQIRKQIDKITEAMKSGEGSEWVIFEFAARNSRTPLRLCHHVCQVKPNYILPPFANGNLMALHPKGNPPHRARH